MEPPLLQVVRAKERSLVRYRESRMPLVSDAAATVDLDTDAEGAMPHAGTVLVFSSNACARRGATEIYTCC
jgi:hypothetical protein